MNKLNIPGCASTILLDNEAKITECPTKHDSNETI